jgi:hypothetical protein
MSIGATMHHPMKCPLGNNRIHTENPERPGVYVEPGVQRRVQNPP